MQLRCSFEQDNHIPFVWRYCSSYIGCTDVACQAAQRDQQRDGRVDRDDRHEQPRREDAGRSETFEQQRHGGKSDDTSTRYGDCSASNEVSGTYVIDARGWTARVAPFVCVCVGMLHIDTMRVTPSGSCCSLASLSYVNDSLQSPIQLRTCTVEMRVDRPRATCAMHRIGAHVFERRLRYFFREPCARPVGCRSAMTSSFTQLDLARGEDAGAHRRGHRHEELDVR